MEFKSVVGETSAERTIEKSRFLSFIAHTEGEEEAKRFLREIRAAHPLSTHVCYGFIADKTGNLQRFSDDGEPQGTAGMPILGVLKARELRETTIAVVRYFGGIKLGAGGLTRAYAGLAAECAEKAQIRLYSTGVELTLTVDYSLVNAAMKFLESEIVLAKEFGEKASFKIMVKETLEHDFIARAKDFLCGRVEISSGERPFYPFPE